MKPFFQKVPRLVVVLVLLALFGLVRSPLEDGLRTRLVEANLLTPPPAQGAFEQMGQSALMGTLGGLRSLVATFLTLEAFEHFSTKSWDDLRQSYQIITALEPRDETHWVSVIWHLGINATANMEVEGRLPAFERERRFKEYAFQAIDFAERGIEQIPESSAIRIQLAEIYREKLKDDCAVARVYGDTIGLPDAPGYVRRFHGYFMARCPGREKEAYAYLMALYQEGEQQRLPTLIKEIQNLEEKLGIPGPRRIPDADPDRPQKTPRRPPNLLPGDILVPFSVQDLRKIRG
ncbi:MAG: hypothetical protein JNJ70_23985 [Verrucomicrobiales bacterium]|nr:hypothetical protein [Verrucomicrobiales bacterium]